LAQEPGECSCNQLQIVQTETPIRFAINCKSVEDLLKGSMAVPRLFARQSHKRPLSTGQRPLVEVDDDGGSCPQTDPHGRTRHQPNRAESSHSLGRVIARSARQNSNAGSPQIIRRTFRLCAGRQNRWLRIEYGRMVLANRSRPSIGGGSNSGCRRLAFLPWQAPLRRGRFRL
jgi:hypothetical protein